MATIVLLHGFAATNFTWRDVETPLRDAGHEVLALERPFGPPWVAASKTVDAIGNKEVVIVGHSAGADIAVQVATRGTTRVCGLVLAAPVVGGAPPAFVRAFAAAPIVRRVAPPLLRVGVRVGLPFALKQTWADRSKVTAEIVDGFRRPLLEPGATEALWSMTASTNPTTPDWDRLKTTPVLVVKGDRDKWVTPVPAPKAETIIYENCGHLPHEECAERFVKDVLAFVERVT
ncbi:MAG: alpha/beta hydrolase [Acidimicrobiales bacterium]|nr:alpha/beta hydrolase [Acidimicrobiales bacterium]